MAAAVMAPALMSRPFAREARAYALSSPRCSNSPSSQLQATTGRQARPGRAQTLVHTRQLTQCAKQNDPVRMSNLFMPTLKAAQQASSFKEPSSGEAAEHSLNLLLRGGYIRQSSSGVYTLLPLGLRIIKKLEAIIEDEMTRIGASRIEMPTLLSSALWRKTGRITTMGGELYRLRDRRGSEYILGPTYEEEVTKLVSDEVHSGRALPVRVFQISTKHRDEPRPRSGLLRTRAFSMKDLYTFDVSLEAAAETYDQVRDAYTRIFNRLLALDHASSSSNAGAIWKGWRAAEADTGAIGGHRSHEYHMEDAAGEDHLLSCDNVGSCSYAANVERAVSLPSKAKSLPHTSDDVTVHLFGPAPTSVGKGATSLITGGTLHAVVSRQSDTLNDVKVQRLLSELNASSISSAPQLLWSDASPGPSRSGEESNWDWVERPEGPLVRFSALKIALDVTCSSLEAEEIEEAVQRAVQAYASPSGTQTPTSEPQPQLADFFPSQLRAQSTLPSAAQLPVRHVDVRVADEGDTCASCGTGKLIQHRAVEVGHTFLLGTKYSDALEVGFAPVADKSAGAKAAASTGRQPFQMGCYGIGVTRLLGILAQRAASAFGTVRSGSQTPGGPASGFFWPPSVAPFGAVVVVSNPMTTEKQQAVNLVVQKLSAGLSLPSNPPSPPLSEADILIDDRPVASLGAKLKDADLLGSSLVVVLGKHWEKTGEVEVRQTGHSPVYLSLSQQ